MSLYDAPRWLDGVSGIFSGGFFIGDFAFASFIALQFARVCRFVFCSLLRAQGGVPVCFICVMPGYLDKPDFLLLPFFGGFIAFCQCRMALEALGFYAYPVGFVQGGAITLACFRAAVVGEEVFVVAGAFFFL